MQHIIAKSLHERVAGYRTTFLVSRGLRSGNNIRGSVIEVKPRVFVRTIGAREILFSPPHISPL